jgi:hypothetical protein
VRHLQRADALNDNRLSPTPPELEQQAVTALFQRSELQTEDYETAVPRDSRLLQDAQGKLMFVGDSAPMSYLQSVRHLLTALGGADGFASDVNCDSLLEQADANSSTIDITTIWPIPLSPVDLVVREFNDVTGGFLDIGQPNQLGTQIAQWAAHSELPDDVHSAVNYLILAIGMQNNDEKLANAYYHRAREIAMSKLTSDTSPSIVQCFLLIAFYMLRNNQPNGAFLYFGLAARASYSIGMHRREVNARFGQDVQKQRERL